MNAEFPDRAAEPVDRDSSDRSGDAAEELLAELVSLRRHLQSHPNALTDEQSRCETNKWVFSILQVALDCFVWGDTARPRFVDIAGPSKKWGGDNSDAFYQHVPLDPGRRYRVRGRRGDAVYLSLTVYGGPDDGRYSDRIVGTVNDRDLTFGPDGSFELWLGPEPEPGPGIVLEPDSVVGITRDYLADPDRDQRTEWRIESLDPTEPWRERDADLARRFTTALTWVRFQSAIVPIAVPTPNHVDDPYPVPSQTFGWAAGDAAYAMGGFDLAEGGELVLRGRSPECAFWNMCLWNPLLHTYNWAYERVTINGAQVVPEADGSWEIVIADHDPGHPNWVSTQGHPNGLIWFRWFHPAETPGSIWSEVRGRRSQI